MKHLLTYSEFIVEGTLIPAGYSGPSTNLCIPVIGQYPTPGGWSMNLQIGAPINTKDLDGYYPDCNNEEE